MLRPSVYAALGLGALALLGASAARTEEDAPSSPSGGGSGGSSSRGSTGSTSSGGADQIVSVLEASDPNVAAAALRQGAPIAGPGVMTSSSGIATSGIMYRQSGGWSLYLGETIEASGEPAYPFASSRGYVFRLQSTRSDRGTTRDGRGRYWRRSNPIPWEELGSAIVWLVTFGAVKPKGKAK